MLRCMSLDMALFGSGVAAARSQLMGVTRTLDSDEPTSEFDPYRKTVRAFGTQRR